MFKAYIAYLRDNPEGKWFKAKLYGWGWTPARWQGWVTLLVFIGGIFGGFYFFDKGSHSASDTLRPFLLYVFVLVVLLLVICSITGEKPRWQWGVPAQYKEPKERHDPPQETR